MFLVRFISSQIVNERKLFIEYTIYFHTNRVRKARDLVRDAMARYSTYERGILYKVKKNGAAYKEIATISRDPNARPCWD